MIDNILTLLELAKEQNIRSQYIDIALGKNKLTLSYNDIKNTLKLNK